MLPSFFVLTTHFFFCLACWLQKLLSCYSMSLLSDLSPPDPTIFISIFGSGPGCYLVILHKKVLLNCVDSGWQTIIWF